MFHGGSTLGDGAGGASGVTCGLYNLRVGVGDFFCSGTEDVGGGAC